MDASLILRTAELERRLEGLNQLRQDVVRDRDLFVRKDMFDAAVTMLSQFKADYQEAHAAIVTRVTVMETRSIVWTAAIAFIFILLNLALHLWK